MTLRRFLFMFGTLGAIAATPAAADPVSVSRAELNAAQDTKFLATPEAYLTAQRNFDTIALSKLTDPDFIEISPVGEIDRRDKMLSFYTSDKKSPAPPMQFDRIWAWKNGASGTIIGKVIYTIALPSGETRKSQLSASFQLRRTKGQWTLLSVQYTPVRPSGPKPTTP